MELSTALIDGSASIDEIEDYQGPADVLVVEEALRVCALALKSDGCLPKTTSTKVVRYLQQQRAVDVFENGDIALVREAVNYGLSLSEAVLETTLRDFRTTLEMQTDLKKNGWKFLDDLRSASLGQKKLIIDNPKVYYSLIFHFGETLLLYEEEEMFHHRQGEKYYLAMEAAVVHHPDDVVDIPTYKQAAYYVELRKYLSGEIAKDPRLGEDAKPRRTDIDRGLDYYSD